MSTIIVYIIRAKKKKKTSDLILGVYACVESERMRVGGKDEWQD